MGASYLKLESFVEIRVLVVAVSLGLEVLVLGRLLGALQEEVHLGVRVRLPYQVLVGQVLNKIMGLIVQCTVMEERRREDSKSER